MAAARNVSADPRMTRRPRSVDSLAILPTVVVLPVPLMPTNSTNAGSPPKISSPPGVNASAMCSFSSSSTA